jgi:hypothetical protein
MSLLQRLAIISCMSRQHECGPGWTQAVTATPVNDISSHSFQPWAHSPQPRLGVSPLLHSRLIERKMTPYHFGGYCSLRYFSCSASSCITRSSPLLNVISIRSFFKRWEIERVYRLQRNSRASLLSTGVAVDVNRAQIPHRQGSRRFLYA